MGCLQEKPSSHRASRGKMWSSYHTLRSTEEYKIEWSTFLRDSGSAATPIFCQHVGHYVFKKIIEANHSIAECEATRPEKDVSTALKEITSVLNTLVQRVERVEMEIQKKQTSFSSSADSTPARKKTAAVVPLVVRVS